MVTSESDRNLTTAGGRSAPSASRMRSPLCGYRSRRLGIRRSSASVCTTGSVCGGLDVMKRRRVVVSRSAGTATVSVSESSVVVSARLWGRGAPAVDGTRTTTGRTAPPSEIPPSESPARTAYRKRPGLGASRSSIRPTLSRTPLVRAKKTSGSLAPTTRCNR
ncbi:conserved hypothetical protein [Ricinus communis]|uniref:Uncharacterized protein n=1 Tax=Ricinus communis TaxID=3988 RepID=B9TEZ2_RICCO|nr:conserved hypothetical protein [Ricinus communis]